MISHRRQHAAVPGQAARIGGRSVTRLRPLVVRSLAFVALVAAVIAIGGPAQAHDLWDCPAYTYDTTYCDQVDHTHNSDGTSTRADESFEYTVD